MVIFEIFYSQNLATLAKHFTKLNLLLYELLCLKNVKKFNYQTRIVSLMSLQIIFFFMNWVLILLVQMPRLL